MDTRRKLLSLSGTTKEKEHKGWHDNQCKVGEECKDCTKERERRNILLGDGATSEKAGEKLADPRFKRCMLVTPFNKAVFQFATHRAETFAAEEGQQLFYMQAIDTPPANFADTYETDELEQKKRSWLQYH